MTEDFYHILTPDNSELLTCTLSRIFLSPKENPHLSLDTEGHEMVIYPLIGEARVDVVLDDKEYLVNNAPIRAGRRSLFPEESVKGFCALRVPPINLADVNFSVRGDFEALVFETNDDMSRWITPKPVMPAICYDWDRQLVGRYDEQRFRDVWHLEKPYGFHLDVGETHNTTGQWSSHPAHASKLDRDNFAHHATKWEEVFFCALRAEHDADDYAIMMMDGYFPDRERVTETRMIRNGDAFATPLGRHPIIAPPLTDLWYFWGCYGDAMKKVYNRRSTDTRTYVK